MTLIAMDDKNTKPLRTTSNKIKDLMNTYLKNQEGRQIPISSPEQDNAASSETSEEQQKPETKIKEEQENIEKEALQELFSKLDDTIKERDELREQLKRLAAEMENIRRRNIREKQDLIDYANIKLLYNILPVIDDFEKALDAARKTTDYEALLAGIEMIYSKSLKILEDAGVKPMDNPIGKHFDVDFHEALAMLPSEYPEGIIFQLIQAGYMFRDKVLRHAKVITSSGNENNSESTSN